MKTFIISMSLLAVTAAYIALRLPIEKTKTEKPTVTENGKREKGGTIRVRILSQVEKSQRKRLDGSSCHYPRVCRGDW